MTNSNDLEYLLLLNALGDETAAQRLSAIPGGWRNLTQDELLAIGLEERHAIAVRAIQELTRRAWPSLPHEKLLSVDEVARVYVPRLAGQKDEIVLAIAVDSDGFLLQELELGRNTGEGFGLSPACVLRRVIRSGASAFLVVLNNPTGKPTVTPDLRHFGESLQRGGNAVDVLLLDVLVVGSRDSGWVSLAKAGVLST